MRRTYCCAFIVCNDCHVCGVSLADEAPIKGSAEFFDQYCSECHYEDQSGGLDLSELTFEPDNRDNFATWVRVFDRVAAGEMPPKEGQRTPRAGGPRDVHPHRFIFSHRLREGSHGPRRPRHAAPAQPLRIRKRAARSAERPVGAGEGQAAARRRSVSLQQERRGARRVLRADGALPDARRTTRCARPCRRRSNGRRRRRGRSTRATPSGSVILPRENGTLPDRLTFPVLDSHAQPDVRAGRAPNSSPETREREAVGKVSSIFSDAGGYGWGFSAPVAGPLPHPAEGLLESG